VWGGVFLSITEADGGPSLDVRKRLRAQAAALQVFAAAYQASGEARYANALSAVDEFLQESLMVSDGSFYAGQLPAPENLPPRISVQRYWALRTEHERRRFGIPGVDEEISTAANAQLISGYAQGYAATGEMFFLRVAERAARNLLEKRRVAAGWFLEGAADDIEALPSLDTQGLMGLALVDLYQSSADAEWLSAATLTARAVVEQAEWSDGELGAVNAVEFLHRLSRLQSDSSWRDSAAELLGQASKRPLPSESSRLARFGQVLETFASGYVELVISGAPDSPSSRRLYAAALAVYQPGKLVMMDRLERFSSTTDSALHVCAASGCLNPITDPTMLRAALETLDPAAD
jgi:uncharacterized protein YyaL (SSP411 family)